jgi:hypothetical protein
MGSPVGNARALLNRRVDRKATIRVLFRTAIVETLASSYSILGLFSWLCEQLLFGVRNATGKEEWVVDENMKRRCCMILALRRLSELPLISPFFVFSRL